MSETIVSLRNKVSEMQSTQVAMKGSTSSTVLNARAKLDSAKAQLMQAQATLQRTESDSRPRAPVEAGHDRAVDLEGVGCQDLVIDLNLGVIGEIKFAIEFRRHRDERLLITGVQDAPLRLDSRRQFTERRDR